MATIFPLSPSVNDTYVSNGIVYVWDGEAWVRTYEDTSNVTSLIDISASSVTVSTNSETVINSFSGSTYRSADINVQITQGTEYYFSKVSMLHDGTTAYLTEYAIIENNPGTIPVTLSASVSGGNIQLKALITNAATTNATVKTSRSGITV